MTVDLASGFAVVGSGVWLFGRAQPAAVRGAFQRRFLRGFICPDRAALSIGELAAAEGAGDEAPRPSQDDAAEQAAEDSSSLVTRHSSLSAEAHCASADRPFLTRIDCGVPVSAVSDKILVAPAAARTGAKLVKVIPLSFARAIGITEFASPADRQTVEPSDRQTGSWVIMATRSRTTRIALEEDESLGVRPEAAVAWTGARPTGFCPRLRLLDVLLPRGPRDLLLHFHGPAIVWIEGSEPRPLYPTGPRKAVF